MMAQRTCSKMRAAKKRRMVARTQMLPRKCAWCLRIAQRLTRFSSCSVTTRRSIQIQTLKQTERATFTLMKQRCMQAWMRPRVRKSWQLGCRDHLAWRMCMKLRTSTTHKKWESLMALTTPGLRMMRTRRRGKSQKAQRTGMRRVDMLHDEHGRLELVPSMPRADGNFRIIAWLLILSFCWYHLICNDMHCTWSWAKVMLLLFQTSDHGTRAGWC
mmetsp:Transcript_21027/g.58436  ORF Transcript_21027/g.58436 Transcript_21027/m.58436 type:complete len:215 (+) Transcript_21027:356-1000(+)